MDSRVWEVYQMSAAGNGAMTRPIIVPVTSATDGLSHMVTIDAMAIGIRAGEGRYVATCHAAIESASLAEPPGPPCSACRIVLCGLDDD